MGHNTTYGGNQPHTLMNNSSASRCDHNNTNNLDTCDFGQPQHNSTTHNQNNTNFNYDGQPQHNSTTHNQNNTYFNSSLAQPNRYFASYKNNYTQHPRKQYYQNRNHYTQPPPQHHYENTCPPSSQNYYAHKFSQGPSQYAYQKQAYQNMHTKN